LVANIWKKRLPNSSAGSAALADAEPAAKKQSDLPVRVASAMVMVAVAGLAFWLRGWVLDGFILAIVLGVLFEWSQLAFAFEPRRVRRVVWIFAGLFYLGLAAYTALILLAPVDVPFIHTEIWPLPIVIAAVIGVDVGAYFAGRTLGGPRIAPAVSP
jgi:phosphatidate cytidylyltransferase